MRDLSFSLAKGECFALLGVNGSGKTTTFKSITNAVYSSSFTSIKVGGFSTKKEFDEARKLIGYCPQDDLILESLTVEEHLQYYAMIKGIPMSKRKQIIQQTIE